MPQPVYRFFFFLFFYNSSFVCGLFFSSADSFPRHPNVNLFTSPSLSHSARQQRHQLTAKSTRFHRRSSAELFSSGISERS
jgi:hypothetical protein